MPEASVLHKPIASFEDAADFLAQNAGTIRFGRRRGKHTGEGWGRFVEVQVDHPEYGTVTDETFIMDGALNRGPWNVTALYAVQSAERVRRVLVETMNRDHAAQFPEGQ